MEVNPTNANQQIASEIPPMICVIPWFYSTPGCPHQHQDHPEPLNKQFYCFSKSLPEKWVEITKFPSIEKTACLGLERQILFPPLGEHHETCNLKVPIFA